MLAGYTDVGIEKNSENHKKAIELLTTNNLPHNILIEHTLNSKFMRVNISNKNQIDSLSLQQQINHSGQIIILPIQLTKEQKEAINTIYSLYNQDTNIRQQNINTFMEEWGKRNNLKILQEWWDNINTNVQLTSVGRVLAHSNAQRCDKSLPPLT